VDCGGLVRLSAPETGTVVVVYYSLRDRGPQVLFVFCRLRQTTCVRIAISLRGGITIRRIAKSVPFWRTHTKRAWAIPRRTAQASLWIRSEVLCRPSASCSALRRANTESRASVQLQRHGEQGRRCPRVQNCLSFEARLPTVKNASPREACLTGGARFVVIATPSADRCRPLHALPRRQNLRSRCNNSQLLPRGCPSPKCFGNRMVSSVRRTSRRHVLAHKRCPPSGRR
jgi:hypothetical protein